MTSHGCFVLLDHAPLVPGPGAVGRGGVASAVLFAAGGGLRTLDVFAAFWADEAPDLDWLDDFLCDPGSIRFSTGLPTRRKTRRNPRSSTRARS